MIDPADQSLVLRAIRNASAEQLRQIIEALGTATAGKVNVYEPTAHAIVAKRAGRRGKGAEGEGRAIAPKS